MSGRVAYQGAPGAFGEEACRRFLPGWTAFALPTFAAVAAAVASGEAQRGMLPLVNSTAGPVPGVADLIAGHGLAIAARHDLAIRIHLLALPDTNRGAIRRVASHPMALAQCADWLARERLEAVPAANTALAARALAESRDPTRAVAASEHAAAVFGLFILARDIHDRHDNVTTFAELRHDGI